MYTLQYGALLLLRQDLQMATGVLPELLRHQCCQKLTWNARKSFKRCQFLRELVCS